MIIKFILEFFAIALLLWGYAHEEEIAEIERFVYRKYIKKEWNR